LGAERLLAKGIRWIQIMPVESIMEFKKNHLYLRVFVAKEYPTTFATKAPMHKE